MARQITIRGISPDLSRRLKEVGLNRGMSVNSVVLELLGDALGVNERRKRLERYATWTAVDFKEFDKVLRSQRVVDAKLWR